MRNFSWGIALLACALLAPPARACLHFIEDKPPAPVALTLKERLLRHEGQSVWQGRVAHWQPIADREWDFRSQNNYAASLAHVGRYQDALQRLHTIERVLPGHPFTAYNLATVYELKGDLPRALKWVKTGVAREKNTASRHALDKTEWLHVRILEARMRAQLAPESLGAQSIAGLDFGRQTEPQTPIVTARDADGQPYSPGDVSLALFEQTHERLEFVPAPDPVVADLLFDLANLSYADEPEQAREVLEMALQYGPRRASLAQKRFDALAGKPNTALIGGILALLSGGLIGFLWRKKQAEKREWQALPVQELDAVAPLRKPVCIEFKTPDDASD